MLLQLQPTMQLQPRTETRCLSLSLSLSSYSLFFLPHLFSHTFSPHFSSPSPLDLQLATSYARSFPPLSPIAFAVVASADPAQQPAARIEHRRPHYSLTAIMATADAQNGSVHSSVGDAAAGIYSRAQRSLDRVVPSSARQQAYDSTAAFASARPILFVRLPPTQSNTLSDGVGVSPLGVKNCVCCHPHLCLPAPSQQSFAVSQAAFSFLPLLTFAVFSLSTVAFALGAAIVFALFWIGLAFMILVPALLVTFSIALLVWAWALGSFLVARWIYSRIPASVSADFEVTTAGKRLSVVKDEKGGVEGSLEPESK